MSEHRASLHAEGGLAALPVAPSITLQTARVDTPTGRLFLVAREGTLVAASFDGREVEMPRALERRFGAVSLEDHPDPGGIVARLRAYFGGDLRALDAIPADPGGTPFQRRVWAALRRIPVGTTLSYSMMARDIGDPDAVRAVGTANGSNPVPVVIPCHRVIGADGSLTGYGGGLERKRWLLVHEGVRSPGLQTRLPFDAAR
jgi:methylated-DNA-[protein]-cysteine S-methyltransferase